MISLTHKMCKKCRGTGKHRVVFGDESEGWVSTGNCGSCHNVGWVPRSWFEFLLNKFRSRKVTLFEMKIRPKKVKIVYGYSKVKA